MTKVRAGIPERGEIPERSPPYTVLLPDRKTYAHCYIGAIGRTITWLSVTHPLLSH